MKNKSVPSKVYDKQYYLTINDGGALGKQNNSLSPRLAYMLKKANVRKNDVVLDVGCGTGELCFAAAKKAKMIVGIDYSSDAIKMCNKKKESARERSKIIFIKGDATKIRLKHKFTVVFMTDVVEHLYPAQLSKLFDDLKPILAKNAKIYIHTAPNLEFYRYGYPVIRFCYPLLRHISSVRKVIETKHNWRGKKHLPKDPEQGSHNKIGHVNEQTPQALREFLKNHGYNSEIYTLPFLREPIDTTTRIAYIVLSLPILKKMFNAEIVAVATVK